VQDLFFEVHARFSFNIVSRQQSMLLALFVSASLALLCYVAWPSEMSFVAVAAASVVLSFWWPLVVLIPVGEGGLHSHYAPKTCNELFIERTCQNTGAERFFQHDAALLS